MCQMYTTKYISQPLIVLLSIFQHNQHNQTFTVFIWNKFEKTQMIQCVYYNKLDYSLAQTFKVTVDSQSVTIHREKQ